MKGKTSLKRKVKNTSEPTNDNEVYTQSKIIKGKTSLGKNKNRLAQQPKKLPEQNKTESLIEQIVLTYFASHWKKQIYAMKNRVSGRPNKKSKDIRTLVRVIDRALNYHTYLYLMELFDNMKNMPVPRGVEHDPNYGKLILVKSEETGDQKVEIEIKEEIVITDQTNLREKRGKDKPEKKINYDKDEDDGLAIYRYRNDGKPIDRIEIEKNINRLIDEYPEKDIDVERILNSKRLQYKLKHPRFSPFTKKENLESFVRYLYTYKPEKNKGKNDNIIVIKNKTYAYY